MSNLTGIAFVLSRIIFKVSSMDFIFRDLFATGLEGDRDRAVYGAIQPHFTKISRPSAD